MTALAKDRKTAQYGSPDEVVPGLLSFPVAAATTIYGGSLVATNASGYAVPASASNALKLWGRAEQQVVNTTAAGYGTAGALNVTVKPGVFAFAASGSITIADVGKACYAVDDQTISLTDGAGLYPYAGVIFGVAPSGEIYVGVGVCFTSPYSADDDTELANYQVRTVRARNVVPANVADLGAFTVAGNDGITNVAGDVVLLVAQTTAAQNGLYQVGTVAAGAAPLTRLGAMAAGDTMLAGQLVVHVAVGTLFANTEWKNTAASGVVGTNDLAFYPKTVIQSLTLVAGTTTITNVPILSATKSQIVPVRKTANTCSSTIQYVTNGAATPGALGTASVEVMAAIDAGTINAADISTLEIAIHNW